MEKLQYRCYFDVNIFLEILWKENENVVQKNWKNSLECLESNKINCFFSYFGLLILNYKFIGGWTELTDELKRAKNIREAKKVIDKYPDKKAAHDFILKITKKVDEEYWNLNDAVKYFIKKEFRKIEDEIKKLSSHVCIINTNIKWQHYSGLRLPKSDYRNVLTVPVKRQIILENNDSRQKLIKERIEKLKNCLEDKEDRINYSIAKTMMMDFFVTRDKEFYKEDVIECIKTQILSDYIAKEPEEILELVK